MNNKGTRNKRYLQLPQKLDKRVQSSNLEAEQEATDQMAPMKWTEQSDAVIHIQETR